MGSVTPAGIEGLLEQLGGSLRAAPLGPDPDFASTLRRRLVAVATVAPPAPAVARRRPGLRRGALGWRVAIGGAGMALTVAGVTAAGVLALPGDAFYGLKHHEEGVELALARSDQAKGLLHLRFARTRLDEVTDLLDRAGVTTAAGPLLSTGPRPDLRTLSPGLAKLVTATLREMDVQTREGATLLTRTYLRQRQVAPLARLTTFTTQQKVHLATVSVVLTDRARPAATTSLKVLDSVSRSTQTLLQTTPPLPNPPAASGPDPSAVPSTVPSVASASPAATSTSAEPSAAPSDSPSPVSSPAAASASPSEAPSPEPSARPSARPSASPSPGADPSPAASPAPSPVAASTDAAQAAPDQGSSGTGSTGGQAPPTAILTRVRFQ